jgi:GTP-binding conserved hypothetical protein TIGR00650
MRRIALAGKPNAGKSTFFSAATMSDVEMANYPFTTIDPNRGVAHARTRCPCTDRDADCGICREGARYVPVELVDIAGLVPGAHTGRGLGNQFLDALTTAEAIVTVIDAAGATTAEGEPVAVGTTDPLEEVRFIEEELEAWMAQIIADNWTSVRRGARAPGFDLDAALAEVLSGLGITDHVITAVLREAEYPAQVDAWGDGEFTMLAQAVRQRAKPIVICANKVDLAPSANIADLQTETDAVLTAAIAERTLRRGVEAGVVEYRPGDDEFQITGEVDAQQRAGLDAIADLLAQHGSTGVQETIDRAVYGRLELITAYPVQNETRWTDASGQMLPDALLLPAGSTPRDLAYAVHSDIGEGYLYAIDARSQRRIGEATALEEGAVIKIVSTAD